MRGPKQGKGGYVYMMGNAQRTVIYTGVTADIEARVWQHKHGQGGIFTSTYYCTDLLWFEQHDCIEEAINRESQIKNWKRALKVELVRKMNPDLKDLAAAWFDDSQERDSGSSPE
jgi:putative endonuclease